MLLCLCPLSVQAAGVTGDTVLASYQTLIDAYNNFADLHESYLVMLGTQNVSDSVRAYYDGVDLVLDNLYATGSAKGNLATLDAGTLTEINNILTEDIAFRNAASATVQAQMGNGLPCRELDTGNGLRPQAEPD